MEMSTNDESIGVTLQDEPQQSEILAQGIDMVSGTCAGMIAKIIEYPFDTLKVILQAETQTQSNSGLLVFRSLLREGGIRRIFQGLSAPMAGAMLENLIVFWGFGIGERFLQKYSGRKELNMFEIGLAGAFSGIGTGLWLTPVEYVKCQMQHETTSRLYKNTFDCFKHKLRTSPLDLTHGLWPALGREVPGAFIYFTAYKSMCRLLNSNNCTYNNTTNTYEYEDPKSWMILMSGSFSGIAFWTSTYPLDLAKTKQQTIEADKSVFKILTTRFKKFGFRGLYSGLMVTIPRAIISNAFIFFTYEEVKKALNYLV